MTDDLPDITLGEACEEIRQLHKAGERLRAENERLQRERKEINITAQMIEAGVEELRSKSFGMPLEDIVQNVFLMMALEEKS